MNEVENKALDYYRSFCLTFVFSINFNCLIGLVKFDELAISRPQCM